MRRFMKGEQCTGCLNSALAWNQGYRGQVVRICKLGKRGDIGCSSYRPRPAVKIT